MSFFVNSPESENIIIVNDGYFPDLSVDEFRSSHRVNSDYGNEVISQRIQTATYYVNSLLSEFKNKNIEFGSLENYEIQGNIGALALYKQAVYYRAKSQLLIDFQTFTEKDIAENIARNGAETQQSLLSLSQQSLRLLQGTIGAATIELI